MAQNRWSAVRSVFSGGALCHAFPLLTLPFSKKEQNYWRQVTEICQTLSTVFVAYGQRRIQGSKMKGMHLPTSHF